MCDASYAFMALMSVASAGSAYLQQRQAENQAEQQAQIAQERAQEAAAAATATNSLEQEQIVQGLTEERATAQTDKFSVAREAAKNRGFIRASASEAGAFGNLLFSQLQENMANEGYDKSVIDYNYRSAVKNADLKARASDLNMENTIRAYDVDTVDTGQSGLLSGLQIGTAAISGASSGYQMGTTLKGLTSKTKAKTKAKK